MRILNILRMFDIIENQGVFIVFFAYLWSCYPGILFFLGIKKRPLMGLAAYLMALHTVFKISKCSPAGVSCSVSRIILIVSLTFSVYPRS